MIKFLVTSTQANKVFIQDSLEKPSACKQQSDSPHFLPINH